MSFLAFAAGFGDELSKKAEQERKSKLRMEEMKFGADYAQYLDSRTVRDQEAKTQSNAWKFAESVSPNKAVQKIIAARYLATNGDTKTIMSDIQTKDWSGVTEELTSHLPSGPEQPTTPIWMRERFETMGIDPDKTDPKEFSDAEKSFSYEFSDLPQDAPIQEHFKSAKANVIKQEMVANTPGITQEDVDASGVVPSPVAPSSVMFFGARELPSEFNRIISQMDGSESDLELIQNNVTDHKQVSALMNIHKGKKEANMNQSALAAAVPEENVIKLKGKGSVHTPIWIKSIGDGDSEQKFFSTRKDGEYLPLRNVTELGVIVDPITAGMDQSRIDKVITTTQPLRKAQEHFSKQMTSYSEIKSIIQKNPEAAANVVRAASAINTLGFELQSLNSIAKAFFDKDFTTAQSLFSSGMNKMSQDIDSQKQAVLSKLNEQGMSFLSVEDPKFDQIFKDAKRLNLLALQSIYDKLAVAGQTGNAVSANEFDAFRGAMTGNPESLLNQIQKDAQQSITNLKKGYRLGLQNFNSSPLEARVYKNNLGRDSNQFAYFGLEDPENVLDMDEMGPLRRGESFKEPSSEPAPEPAPSQEVEAGNLPKPISIPENMRDSYPDNSEWKKDGIRWVSEGGQLVPKGRYNE